MAAASAPPAAAGPKLQVVPVPMLEDNYSYLVIDTETNTAAVVDPVEPEKILLEASNRGVVPSFVLTTHKHWDHSGGNTQIARLVPGIDIVGGAIDGVEGCTRPVQDEDTFQLGNSTVACILTPGHTRGHISYNITSDDGEEKHVFTGDVLFVGGCGKFFEGSPQEMHQSLYDKLSVLPRDTNVWVGHEYTVSNFKFARTVEPESEALREKAEWAQAQRDAGRFTVPSTIGQELDTNVFMRCNQPTVRFMCSCGGDDTINYLGCLRAMKDQFRPKG